MHRLTLISFFKFTLLAITAFFLCSCSLYKSDGRKAFESSAEQNISLQDFKPIQCDDISKVTYWYETRISSPKSQWIESLPHLEVWQDNLIGYQIRIRTYENHTDQPQELNSVTRCQSTFSSVEEWISLRSFYLKSLEGEQL